MFRRSVVGAILILCSGYLYADKHPVPLDKGISDSKCLECHDDKTKGTVIHPAVQMGCFSCHFVRGSGDDTRIVLKNVRIQTLCTSCHSEKKITPSNNPVHPPVISDCLKCHDPHQSENSSLLKKAEAGDKKSNFCLDCHSQGENVPDKGSRHAALDAGCNSCHLSHKSGKPGDPEAEFHLTKPAPALCLDCHDAKDAGLVKAHQGQPFATANCTQCHDPHQSKLPKLMQANVHPPFADKTCEICHQAPKDGRISLTQDSVRALCATCHDEAVKKIDGAKVAHPGAQGDCTSCHDPHAGKAIAFLKPNPVAVCESCHSDQADAHREKKVLHDPVFKQGCYICHEPHGGNRDHLLRADVNDLCLQCHSPLARGLKNPETNTESILGDTVLLPVGYVAKAPHLEMDVKSRIGHPVPSHPVSGMDPRGDGKSKPLNCVSCHDPHAGQEKNILLSKDGSIRSLCIDCHKEQAQ